jgi:threonine dehydratase
MNPPSSRSKPSFELGLADIAAAEARIRPALAATPLLYNPRLGASLKLESFQITGSYKVRGAFNALAAQIERGDLRPVIAASAGNHGKGVAFAARWFGIDACVVVPSSAPRAKVNGARELGARVIELPGSFDDCAAFAHELAERNRWRFIHPFDDPEVIAGQGTVALEIEHARPDVVVVPVGGGGLAAGMALQLRSSGIRVVGVQVEGVDAMRRLLRGEPSRAPRPTIADGLSVGSPGELSAALCRELLDEIVLVGEEDVRKAVFDLASKDKLVVEGAGAVSVAALPRVAGCRRVAVVSGGNIDFAALFATAPATPSAAAASPLA